MSGQSITDRLTAAKHSVAGHGLAKSVCKATTEEVMGPKKKHTDYLVACTNEPNVSIPQLANLLIERTQSQNWVVVFKSLITVHNIMNFGNERFTQYLASNNCQFNLGSFRDKTGVQGYDMSTFIRRYAKYLNEKAISYRSMAFDFCKVKRGKDDGLLRTMPTDKLLKTLPALQQQLDALLEFDCTPNELTNGVINACFMLMFKDLIRLFACYNDGIINLLEKYFEMNKKQAKEALDIYKKFLVRMDRVSEFLKVAENVGIDKGDIPDLAKAPSSLLEALEEHLKSLESQKASKTGAPPPPKPAPASVTSAINSLAGAPNTSSISEEEKQRILQEENKHIEQMKEKKIAEEAASNPFVSQAPAQVTSPTTAGLDFLSAQPAAPAPTSSAADDLLGLAGSGPNPFTAPAAPAANPGWGAPQTNGTGSMPHSSSFTSDANFDAVFGNNAPPSSSTGFDGFGEVMKPANQGLSQGSVPQPRKQDEKLIKGDVDSSLANLVGNLGINGPTGGAKKGQQWNAGGEKKMTGGTSWSGPQMGMTAQPMGMGTAPMGQQYGGGGMGMMGAGMAQQPGMMGMQQQPMMGQMRPMQPGMGMAQQPAMAQTNQAPKPNDPFGAL